MYTAMLYVTPCSSEERLTHLWSPTMSALMMSPVASPTTWTVWLS